MSNDESGNEPNDEMSDVKFDSWLQSAARDYNRPGDAPRDAMWAAIERAVPPVSAAPSHAPSATVMPIARGGATRRYWQAAAAVAILAAGIGIGRLWSPRAAAPGEAPAVAATPESAAPETMLASGDTASRRAVRAERAVAAPSLGGEEHGSDSYDIAAVQHMSRAEALLTSFRTSGSGETSASMNVWARDLLADTRLLLDSPAATDARRRHLLEDLELVLAQIVQLPAESSADRSVVQRSIERGAMLSRLRSTIPAGFSSGT